MDERVKIIDLLLGTTSSPSSLSSRDGFWGLLRPTPSSPGETKEREEEEEGRLVGLHSTFF
jgi:hypothetical protein